MHSDAHTQASPQPDLGVVHQARAKALDLLTGSDCAEGDLPKGLLVERAVGDSPHHIVLSAHNRN